ncbi:glutamate dehydrogenase (NADP(+)) [Salvia divinorum]|uniref:Glutamate dehydrogenase (NADP(+)) n=1 Tax=Salvia divinorum TaxID=28513 RepID=A0ABD1H0I9_SALDI
MGVGTREMSFLYGQFNRVTQGNVPTVNWFGSGLKVEALAYGLVFFAHLVLAGMEKDLKGLRSNIYGFGKFSFHVLQKLIEFGAIPISVSGCLFDDTGFDSKKIALVKKIKAEKLSLRHYSETYGHSVYSRI